MKLLDQSGHQATISLTRKEALMMLIYVQTARDELNCSSPRGQEIENLFSQITQQFLNQLGPGWQPDWSTYDEPEL